MTITIEQQPDVTFSDQGSITLVTPHTEAATAWVDENVQLEGWQWIGTAFAVEPRFLQHLLDGMAGDGLIVA